MLISCAEKKFLRIRLNFPAHKKNRLRRKITTVEDQSELIQNKKKIK